MKDIIKHYSHIINFRYITIILGLIPLPQCLGFFSSSAEEPPARIGYLAFQSPPKLRFHEVEPQADRRKLLTLEVKDDALEPVPIAPVDNPDNSFPLISYGEDNNQSSPSYEIPLVDQAGESYLEAALPPNDPFVSTDLPEPNLDNTDELMEILESDTRGSNRQLRTRVDFIPPYTMDGGNLIMQSKAKYTRKVR